MLNVYGLNQSNNYLKYMNNLNIYIIYSFPSTADKYRYHQQLIHKRCAFHRQSSHVLLSFSYLTNISDCCYPYYDIVFLMMVSSRLVSQANRRVVKLAGVRSGIGACPSRGGGIVS